MHGILQDMQCRNTLSHWRYRLFFPGGPTVVEKNIVHKLFNLIINTMTGYLMARWRKGGRLTMYHSDYALNVYQNKVWSHTWGVLVLINTKLMPDPDIEPYKYNPSLLLLPHVIVPIKLNN